MQRSKKQIAPVPDLDRARILREFDVISEEELAVLFGVSVQTLKNRSTYDLPPFTKTGGKKLFFKDDVRAYMVKRKSH